MVAVHKDSFLKVPVNGCFELAHDQSVLPWQQETSRMTFRTRHSGPSKQYRKKNQNLHMNAEIASCTHNTSNFDFNAMLWLFPGALSH